MSHESKHGVRKQASIEEKGLVEERKADGQT